MKDPIERQSALDVIRHLQTYKLFEGDDMILVDKAEVQTELMMLPSAQPEPLTDKEQRIFRAAMWREEKVCEEVDRKYGREPHEGVLMQICKEIRRKVKGALWT